MTEAATDKRSAYVAVVFLLLAALLLALRAPWGESLWLDETLSAWTVNGSLGDAWTRALSFQTQSPLYYIMLWGGAQSCGSSEVALRSISIVSALLSIGAVFCIARRLTGELVVSVLAAGFLLSCDVFQIGALTARPYALATAFALWSIVFLIDLLREWRVRTVVLFITSLVLTFYAHYLFSVVALAHGVVLLQHRSVLRRLSGWIVGAALVCIPGLLHLQSLQERARGLAFTGAPHISGLLADSLPVPLVVSVVVGVVLGLIWDARFRFSERSRSAIRFLIPYIVVAPIVFLAGSVVGGAAVWLPRYWEWQLGAIAVVMATILASLAGGRGARLAVVVTAIFVLARLGAQRWTVEGWGPAAEVARSYPGKVVLFSGLIEAETRSGAEKPGFEQYIRAPLIAYGRSADIIVARLSGSDEELLDVFKQPVLFVAARKEIAGARAPERFLEIAREAGRVVVEDPHSSGSITVYQFQ